MEESRNLADRDALSTGPSDRDDGPATDGPSDGRAVQPLSSGAQPHSLVVVRRWLPTVPIKVIGDGAYSVIELGLTCVKQQVSLIAPLGFNARLFAPPPAPKPHQKGRPRVVGKRLPNLSVVLSNPKTPW